MSCECGHSFYWHEAGESREDQRVMVPCTAGGCGCPKYVEYYVAGRGLPVPGAREEGK